MRKKNIRSFKLFIKEGFLSTIKNKLSLLILILLTLLSSAFLSSSISAYQQITDTYNNSFAGKDNADFYNSQKSFFTNLNPNLSDEPDSFTPVYDILPSYISISKKNNFNVNKTDTFYEMFMNNDTGVYTKPGSDDQKINTNPILLNPFKFLYTLSGDEKDQSWLGVKEKNITSLMNISFNSNNLANIVNSYNKNNSSQFKDLLDLFQKNINTKLIEYINNYISYKNNDSKNENSEVNLMNNSIFKYSLICQYINKNYLKLNNKNDSDYKGLETYISGISNDIANYITKTLYQFYLTNVSVYITQWNNGFYQNLNLLHSDFNKGYWKNEWDVMQDDIDGKLASETNNESNDSINKTGKPLPITVDYTSSIVKNHNLPISLKYIYEYITGMSYDNSNTSNDDFTKPIFNNNCYDETKTNSNINLNSDNFPDSNDWLNEGTKGLSGPLYAFIQKDNIKKTITLSVDNSESTLIHYSGYSDFYKNTNIYEYYEFHKYYASNISNFTIKNSLEMIITQKNTKYALMSYKSNFSNSFLNNQENMDIVLYKGSMPKLDNQVIISPGYAKLNHVNIGNTITVGKDQTLTIVGIGINPLQLYPMIDSKDPIINPSSEAIIYTDSNIIETIATNNPESYVTVDNSYYSYHGDKKNINNDLVKMNAYSNYNNGYINYYNDLENNIINHNLFDVDTNIVKNFTPSFKSTDIELYEKTVFTDTDKMFLILNIIVSSIILIVSLISVLIITKNTIHRNAAQIALLKSIGIQKSRLLFCYGFLSIFILLTIPIGFILGLFLQFIFIDNFSQIFSIISGKIVFGWIAFLVSFCIVGLFSILSSIILTNKLINKSSIVLMKTNIEYRKSKFAEKLDKLLKNRNFNLRFKISLATSSIKKISMLGGVILFSSIAITLSLVMPTIINTISDEYSKVETFSNSTDYNSPIFNNPISRMTINEWSGQQYLEKEWSTNKNNEKDSNAIPGSFKSIDDYYKINSNSSIVPPFIEKNNNNKWIWTPDIVSDNNFSTSNLLDMLIQNILNSSGKNLGIYTFDGLLNWSKDYYGQYSKEYNELQAFLSTTVPQLMKTLFNYSGTSTQWRDEALNSILNSLPALVDSSLQSTLTREIYSFGWNNVNYQPKKDTLITKIQDSLNINNSWQNSSEIGLPQKENVINMSNSDNNELFNNKNLIDQLKPSSNASINNSNQKIIIPVLATKAAQYNFGLTQNQIIPIKRNMEELQYKRNDGSYGEIDPSWWQYYNSDTKKYEPLYDYTKKGSEFNNARDTYYGNSDDSYNLGYEQWNDETKQFQTKKYYNTNDITLKIPKDNGNNININDWIGPYSGSKDQLLTQDNNFYYFKPFNYDIFMNNIQEKNPINLFNYTNNSEANGWYHYAIDKKILAIKNYDQNNTYVDKNNSTVNHNQNVYFKIIDFLKEYNNDNFYLNQGVANLLKGYDTNKMNFFNYQPTIQRNNDGLLINQNKNNKILNSDDEPYAWFNGKLSTSDLADFQNSFSMYMPNDDYSAAGTGNYNSSTYIGYNTLKNINGLLKTVNNVGLGISIPLLLSIIICSIILTILISTSFIDDNMKFMTLMKAEGYKKREILNYLFSIFTPIFLIAFIVGYIFVTMIIIFTFYTLHQMKIAVPYEYKLWTLFATFGIVFLVYSFSLILTNYRINKFKIIDLTK